jgi:Haem-degrading
LAHQIQCLPGDWPCDGATGPPFRIENGDGDISVRQVVGTNEISLPVHQDRDVRRHDLLQSPVDLGLCFFVADTAAGHRRATHKFNAPPGGPALPGNEAFGIHAMHPGRFAIFVGGFPIEVDGQVVGAIGVSGGNGEQDTLVGEAGIAALLRSIQA